MKKASMLAMLIFGVAASLFSQSISVDAIVKAESSPAETGFTILNLIEQRIIDSDKYTYEANGWDADFSVILNIVSGYTELG
jgi:hypothetical protein